jgi:hypothetical protein
MKRSLRWRPFLGYLAAGLLLAACVPLQVIRGSGEVVTQEPEITDFERVEVHSAFQVEVRQGETFQVVIEVDEAVVPHLRVEKQGNTLRIGLEPGVSLMGNVTLRGEVTMPTLTGLAASGASEVELGGFSSSAALELDASGASSLRGEIDAGDIRIVASGASQITLNASLQALSLEASGASQVMLTGIGGNGVIQASGGSEVDLAEFTLKDAAVTASGGSDVTVQPSGTLDVEASGGSTIYSLGEPTMGKLQTSGGSSVSRR